ncbi:MOLPALP family lipoprotein [Mesoplasma seiffertii]|uniref:MOLPALP family lipoprotein n=1 Tax=Mesoplasma seiffertii TaxID=28224 RepID=UPI000478BBEC|nr:MOLPALP family lipoprotein [Mesoplasma seiffertii]
MKKMLAVLGAVSLTASSSVAVVACTPKVKDQDKAPDPSTYNNSLANLQGSAALVAKKAILADQHGYSFQTLQNKMGIKLAEKQVNSLNMDGKQFDSKDRGLDEFSTVNELESRYFGNNNSLSKTELTENINLKGKLGNGKGAVAQAVPENIAGILELAMSILPSLTTEVLTNLVGSLGPIVKLPDLNQTLGSQLVSVISSVAKLTLTASKETINKAIDSIDVVQETQSVSVENLTGAMLISLSNGIALLKDPNYELLKVSSDAEIKAGMSKSAKTIIGLLSSKTEFEVSQTDSIIDSIPQYLKVIQQFIKMAQFLQMSLSLYDSTKSSLVTDGNHLFSTAKTNAQYYDENIKGKKVSEKFVSSSINLKYLLTSLKYHLGSINSENDPDGRKLQKLIFILFGDGNTFTRKGGLRPKVTHTLNFKEKNASAATNFVYYVVQELLTDEILGNLYQTIKDINVPVIGSITSLKKEEFIQLFRDEQFYFLIGNIFYALTNDLGVFDANGSPLNQILSKLNVLAATAVYFPKYLTGNLFSSLYKGNFKTEFIIELKAIITVARINVWDKLPENIKNSVDGFLGGAEVPMNLQSVLSKSLKSLIGKTDTQATLGDYYLKLTIPELINDITNDFGIDETKTLKNLQTYGIYFDDFKTLFNQFILNNKYVDSQGKEHTGNLVSQIVENLPDLFNILGFSKNGVIKGSLWEFVIKHFLAPDVDHLNHEIKKGKNITFTNGPTKFAKTAEELETILNNFFQAGPKYKMLYLNGATVPDDYALGKILTDDLITKANLSLEDIMESKESSVIAVVYNESSKVVAENNVLSLANVEINNIGDDQELGKDHLPELTGGIVKIYNKLNVSTDLSLEMNERFTNQELYSWTFEDPELMSDKVSIKSQKMSVLYKNPKTNEQVRYNFKYSRESINKVFNIEYMQKQ